VRLTATNHQHMQGIEEVDQQVHVGHTLSQSGRLGLQTSRGDRLSSGFCPDYRHTQGMFISLSQWP
jgi:hypothetical protein